jgi:5-methyltetrahydrofolate--homocysteine methyltransferase
VAEPSRPLDFLAALDRRPLLLDGGMGTRLIARGLDPSRENTATWSIEHPEIVLEIHRRDIEAGADAILTNTFRAPHFAFTSWESSWDMMSQPKAIDALARVCLRSVELARQAAGPGRFVLGCVGPAPPIELPSPAGWYREQAMILNDAGVDALILETHHFGPALAALREIRDVVRVPMLASLHSLPVGSALKDFALVVRRLADLGAAAVGCNCVGLEEIVPMLERRSGPIAIPLIAKPNAGLPGQPLDGPESFAAVVPKLLALGVRLLGGCCGTTEAHVASMRAALDQALANPHPPNPNLP